MNATGGAILVVVENPSNSGEPISKIEISIPSGFSVSSSSLSVLGEGAGIVSDVSGPVVVDFSSYLKPGSRAYVLLKGVANPSSPGSYTWYVTVYGISGNSLIAGAYPGKSITSTIVSSTGFRSIPYGKVVLPRGNAAAGTGIKQISIANTTVEYILYNPIDSGETISEILLKIPPAYATVAASTIVVSNILLNSQLASVTPGAIAANIQKNISITNLSIAPGSFISISASLITLPATAGDYTWELYVKGASSGQFVKVLDWPGISNAQVAKVIAAPAAGWYMDIFPYYDNISRTIGWNTAGTSNNVYRVNLWRITAWAATSDPYIEFPSGYDLSSAGVSNIQGNGAGVVATSFRVYQVGGLWRVSNDINAAGAANNNFFYTITNIINKSTPSVDTITLTVGDGVTIGSVSGAYDRTVYLLPHLFTTNLPSYGIDIVGGSTNTNSSAVYLFVFKNPANSGDAIDKITISVPAGYSNVDVIWSNISVVNSSAVISSSNITQPSPTTAGSIEINFSTSNPLSEGSMIYLPVAAINPTNTGVKIWGCSFSGLRDVTNISATNIISDMTNRFTIVAVAPPGDGTNYVPTNTTSTNNSSDNIAWLIVANGTFSDTSIVTISKITNYPAPTSSQSNSYRFVGNVYEFISTLAPQKPVKVRIYFSNASTNFLSTNNIVANLKIAYYDPISSSWVVNASSVVGDGYVEMETFTLGKFWIWETISGGGLTNAFSIGKVSGGTISWDKLKIEIPANALIQDTWIIVDTLSTNLSFPSHLVNIGNIYSIESTSALNSSATISIYYTDEEINGRVIDRLRLAFYNNDTKEWVVVPSTVDKQNKRVYTRTLHFSYWTLVEDRTPTSDLVSSVYIYPNPAKSSLKISFSISEMSKTYISVYDTSGSKIKVIKNGENMNTGLNEVTWNLDNEFGNAVVNGVYFVKLDVRSLISNASFSKVYKVVVVK